jgi:hypothetical protein
MLEAYLMCLGFSSLEEPLRPGKGYEILFHRIYLSISLRKSTPPQNCQFNILISDIVKNELTILWGR